MPRKLCFTDQASSFAITSDAPVDVVRSIYDLSLVLELFEGQRYTPETTDEQEEDYIDYSNDEQTSEDIQARNTALIRKNKDLHAEISELKCKPQN